MITRRCAPRPGETEAEARHAVRTEARARATALAAARAARPWWQWWRTIDSPRDPAPRRPQARLTDQGRATLVGPPSKTAARFRLAVLR
ncbi:hypothetical protein K7W42_21790, partial [Deinococcus sp. HMF7604]|uniref:hypothetical protein n=1 Tax=Deinococcus betulae TaxID=2873312 RepID=UPI001CCFDB38